jgi:hypothetical protein
VRLLTAAAGAVAALLIQCDRSALLLAGTAAESPGASPVAVGGAGGMIPNTVDPRVAGTSAGGAGGAVSARNAGDNGHAAGAQSAGEGGVSPSAWLACREGDVCEEDVAAYPSYFLVYPHCARYAYPCGSSPRAACPAECPAP